MKLTFFLWRLLNVVAAARWEYDECPAWLYEFSILTGHDIFWLDAYRSVPRLRILNDLLTDHFEEETRGPRCFCCHRKI